MWFLDSTGIEMPPCSSSNNYSEEEISLRDLLTVLWHSKGLILAIVATMTILAAAYAFLSVPVYRTQIFARAPFANELINYNHIIATFDDAQSPTNRASKDPSPTAALPARSASDDVYQAFLHQLRSVPVRREFFEKIYLPAHADAKTDSAKALLWNQFNQELTIPAPGNSQDAISVEKVTLQGKAPDKIADWLNQYIEMVNQAGRQELANYLEQLRQTHIHNIDTQIEGLRTVAAVKRMNSLSQLNDALKLAEATHIVTPLSAGNLVASYEGSTFFLRGSEALRAEIDLLKARTNDDPYIAELPNLLHTRSLLEKLDISPTHLTVATIDQAAIPPGSPISPRRKLIIILGIALGLILGTLTALVRQKLSVAPRDAISP